MLFAVTLAGCRHRIQWTPPSPMTAPVELDTQPEQKGALIASVPQPVYELPPAPADLWRAPRRRAAPSRENSSAPAPASSGEASEPAEDAALAIGSLSSGGDSTPQTEQQARDLLASIQKRIAGLSRSVAAQQRRSLRQVSSFVKRAQQALDSGDAEGAVNLATKARLLMDDIEKK
jgi:hypothetical protein